MARSLFLVGLLGLSLTAACGGIVEGESTNDDSSRSTPPPVNTRFTLNVDERAIALGVPTATRFTQTDGSTYLSLNATEHRTGGDYIRGVSANLDEPLTNGTFDCTPDANGAYASGVALSPGNFFGFKAKLEDCRITITYVARDRVVGAFTVKGHAPEGSSLDGTISTATGEFDIPIEPAQM